MLLLPEELVSHWRKWLYLHCNLVPQWFSSGLLYMFSVYFLGCSFFNFLGISWKIIQAIWLQQQSQLHLVLEFWAQGVNELASPEDSLFVLYLFYLISSIDILSMQFIHLLQFILLTRVPFILQCIQTNDLVLTYLSTYLSISIATNNSLAKELEAKTWTYKFGAHSG